MNAKKIKPYCSEEDYGIIIRFLNGDETLRDAAAKATDAAKATVAAAWGATKATDWAAADAANAAAWPVWYANAAVVAWDAANAAKYAAACDATYDDMNKILEEMIEEELKKLN